jgi:hypothetical protein
MSNDHDRPETGSMRFGDDWRGVFIRGDNAHHYAGWLRALLDRAAKSDDAQVTLAVMMLDGLPQLLDSSVETGDNVTPLDNPHLRPFAECVRGEWLDLPPTDGLYWLRIGDNDPEPVRVRTERENARDPREECLYVDRLGHAHPTHTHDLMRRYDAPLRWLRITPPSTEPPR